MLRTGCDFGIMWFEYIPSMEKEYPKSPEIKSCHIEIKTIDHVGREQTYNANKSNLFLTTLSRMLGISSYVIKGLPSYKEVFKEQEAPYRGQLTRHVASPDDFPRILKELIKQKQDGARLPDWLLDLNPDAEEFSIYPPQDKSIINEIHISRVPFTLPTLDYHNNIL